MTAEVPRMRITENLTPVPCHRSMLAAVNLGPGWLYWQIGRIIVQQQGAIERAREQPLQSPAPMADQFRDPCVLES